MKITFDVENELQRKPVADYLLARERIAHFKKEIGKPYNADDLIYLCERLIYWDNVETENACIISTFQ